MLHNNKIPRYFKSGSENFVIKTNWNKATVCENKGNKEDMKTS